MELGVKNTGLAALTIGIGGSVVSYSAQILTLEEAMLVIIAASTTANSIFNYLEG